MRTELMTSYLCCHYSFSVLILVLCFCCYTARKLSFSLKTSFLWICSCSLKKSLKENSIFSLAEVLPSNMEVFGTILSSWELLNFVKKSSILDVAAVLEPAQCCLWKCFLPPSNKYSRYYIFLIKLRPSWCKFSSVNMIVWFFPFLDFRSIA